MQSLLDLGVQYLGYFTSGISANDLGRGVIVFTHGNILGTKAQYGSVLSIIGDDYRGMQFNMVTYKNSNLGVVAGEVWKRVRSSFSDGWSEWTKMQ